MKAYFQDNQVVSTSPSRVREGSGTLTQTSPSHLKVPSCVATPVSALRAALRQFRFLAILLIMVVLGTVDATATVYNWSRYDLSFETPENGFVTFNSPTRFEVQWEDMVMTVQLYSKDKGDEKKLLNENLQRKALGFSMYDLHDGKIKVKGFKKTYSIDGTMPDGSRAIIAEKTDYDNLIIEVTVNYLYGNREVVEDMIKSFAENKKQQPNRERKHQKVQTRQQAEKEKAKEKQQEKKPARKEKLYDA